MNAQSTSFSNSLRGEIPPRTETQARLKALRFDTDGNAAISFTMLSALANRGAIEIIASNVSGTRVELCVMERKP